MAFTSNVRVEVLISARWPCAVVHLIQVAHLAATARELGGEVVRTGREREHVFALFRRLAAEGDGSGER